ncbi:polysaccharide deacetylase family protein [Sporolactobacillus pectinivorans]|uniref:polysaccharide deacetylase family protein n=1 Tax=Sporolactobacillus pectinivorans TaxID=1591408 RepID=UPI001EFC47BE|nr:polysaccharide deacetylase family protein [Sporolactobacillus pectinivorans]
MIHFLHIVWAIFFIIISIVVVYGIIPTVVMRPLFFRGAKPSGDAKEQICLTFDDGPSAMYTNRLLDLLKKYHVHATFFVVGERASEHSELLKRMTADGHLIGIHHYRHLSNWFLTPTGTRKQCNMAADAVEAITGVRPVYYRPPWGHINLFLPLEAHSFRIVLWSAILGDWRKKLGKERLKRRIYRHLRDGALICLHDDGENPGADNDAPENTIAALADIFEETAGRYQFVTIDELFQNRQSVKFSINI